MVGNFRNLSRSAGLAVLYVTVGVLLLIWMGVWYYYMSNVKNYESGDYRYYICAGLALSGGALLLIGLLFGVIGRGARAADTTAGVAVGPNTVVGPPAAAAPPAAAPPAAAPVAPAAPR